jgi:hypothetical protein
MNDGDFLNVLRDGLLVLDKLVEKTLNLPPDTKFSSREYEEAQRLKKWMKKITTVEDCVKYAERPQ